VIEEAIHTFVADLETLYQDPDPSLLARNFSADGLRTALGVDWRLRGSVENGISFIGDLGVRGLGTVREEPLSRPPVLEFHVSIAVAPGSRLLDRGTAVELQTWTERQIYALRVVLEYVVRESRWVATSVGAPSEPEFGNPPPILAPPVRCPGLQPDQADTADVDKSRTWCFGGEDGTKATHEQISVLDDYPCGTSSAAIVTLGWPVGAAIDWWDANQFVSDPDGRFGRQWPLPIAYRSDTRLPDDAYSTGLTDGEFEIWVSPVAGSTAIWAKRTTRVERWPRAPEFWGVIDCN
jgi:hypothetical protein